MGTQNLGHVKGATGAAGPQGPAGSVGPQGAQGVAGSAGSNGGIESVTSIVEPAGNSVSLTSSHFSDSALLQIDDATDVLVNVDSISITPGQMVHFHQSGVGQLIMTPGTNVTITTSQTLKSEKKLAWCTLVCVDASPFDMEFRFIGERELV